jgi:hypothetical protein
MVLPRAKNPPNPPHEPATHHLTPTLGHRPPSPHRQARTPTALGTPYRTLAGTLIPRPPPRHETPEMLPYYHIDRTKINIPRGGSATGGRAARREPGIAASSSSTPPPSPAPPRSHCVGAPPPRFRFRHLLRPFPSSSSSGSMLRKGAKKAADAEPGCHNAELRKISRLINAS